jgi:hypothetical protein
MALALFFSALGGVNTQDGPVYVEAGIRVDMEAAEALVSQTQTALPASGTAEGGQAEATMEMITRGVDILNTLKIRGVADGGAAELQLVSGNDVLLSLGGKASDAGVTLASSLLGSQVFFVPSYMLSKMTEQMTAAAPAAGQIPEIDPEQLTKDLTAFRERIIQEIQGRIGETETGAFEADGYSFTARTPVNMTAEEMAELVLTQAKILLTGEALSGAVASLSGNQDIAAELDKRLEELKNLPEDRKTDMTLFLYSAGESDEYVSADLENRDGKFHIGCGMVDSLLRAAYRFGAEGKNADVKAAATPEGGFEIRAAVKDGENEADISARCDATGNMDLLADIRSAEIPAKLHFSTEAFSDGCSFRGEMYLGSDRALLTIIGSFGKGGEITSQFEGEKLKIISADALDSAESQAALNQIAATAMGGLLKAVAVLSRNLPEDTASWMNTQIKNMIAPALPTNR